jgi:hypothetical protein
VNPSNTFNIETSLNSWLQTELDSYTPPAFFSGFPGSRLIMNMPEEPVNVPAFSLHHLLIGVRNEHQGRRTGVNERGGLYEAFMDVSAWVSRKNVNWVADGRWMCAIVTDIVEKTTAVQITDYLTDYPDSDDVEYAIYIGDIDARQTQPDDNPDFERQRFLIKYHTILRSDVS